MRSKIIYQFATVPISDIRLFGYTFSFCNASIYMLSALMIFIAIGIYSGMKLRFFGASFKDQRLQVSIPNRIQALIEGAYLMIVNMANEVIGYRGKQYIPLVFAIFMMIAIINVVGIIPGTFTPTSSIIITFTIAATVFSIITIIGICMHGMRFLSLFIPKQIPIILMPIIFIIELFTYLSRPFSLSLRLTINMIAGHIVLKVIAAIIVLSGIFGILPFALLTILFLFELFIAILQAYIFSILICVYINDAVNLH